jgi:hypothetical protein
LTDVSDRFSQKIAPLVLRSEQDQLDKTLSHLRNQVGQIDRIVTRTFNVFSDDLIYFAVQATFLPG